MSGQKRKEKKPKGKGETFNPLDSLKEITNSGIDSQTSEQVMEEIDKILGKQEKSKTQARKQNRIEQQKQKQVQIEEEEDWCSC